MRSERAKSVRADKAMQQVSPLCLPQLATDPRFAKRRSLVARQRVASLDYIELVHDAYSAHLKDRHDIPD